ncbi:MAG: hypothetical protein ACI9TP_002317, partial [Candidatus Azotimanducaceae bacterium]
HGIVPVLLINILDDRFRNGLDRRGSRHNGTSWLTYNLTDELTDELTEMKD